MTALTSNQFRAVTPLNRLEIPDALRGLALLGIIIANSLSFSGYGWMTAQQHAELAGPADNTLDFIRNVFIDTKFITIFSILFGAGFAMQISKAGSDQVGFRKYFLIRMMLLLLIGCAHAWLLWFGDIIRYYAVTGLTLVLLMGLSDKALVRISILFISGATGLVFILKGVIEFEWPYPSVEALIYTLKNGNYIDVVRLNFALDAFPTRIYPQDTPLTLVSTFGKVYLGYWIGRIGLFSNPAEHMGMLKKWFWWGLAIGFPSSVAYWAISKGLFDLTPALLWLPFVVAGGLVLHSMFYISCFIFVFRTDAGRKALSLFIPVGKMSMTNYLFQTICGIILFYGFVPGFHLGGEVNLTMLLILSVVIFVVQTVLSHIYFKFFQQGPVEFLWRKAAYSGMAVSPPPSK